MDVSAIEPPAFLSNFKDFFMNGKVERPPSLADLVLIGGWKLSTLKGYNCSIKKFMAFCLRTGEPITSLPVTSSALERFCVWDGRNAYSSNGDKIDSLTIKKYMCGLKAWHTFHSARFPTKNKDRIDLMLKSCTRIDASVAHKTPKPAVMLWQLVTIANLRFGGDDFDRAVADLAIVAFWGLARLAELTYDKKSGPLPYSTSLLSSDVAFSGGSTLGEIVTLTIRSAKTASPGTPQLIVLSPQRGIRCPVKAVKRRLAELGTTGTSLFGYQVDGRRVHLTRRDVVSRIQQAVTAGGHNLVLGHSFRVGGASLQFALGMSASDIRRLGRWNSACYKLYIRTYSAEETRRSKIILKNAARNGEGLE